MRIVELTDKVEHLIGSDPVADIRLADDAVARRHAILKSRADNKMTIVPASNDCPVLVNLRFIDGPVALSDGDLVSVGSTTLTFHDAPRSIKVGVLDMSTFQERLGRRIEVCRATGDQVVVLALDLAGSRVGDAMGSVFDELGSAMQEDDLLGFNGTDRMVIAFWFTKAVVEKVCERLSLAVHRIVPVSAMGVASFPEDALDAEGLVGASRRSLRPFASSNPSHMRPLVRTIEVGGHAIHFLDPGMRELFDTIECLSVTDLPVLIQGETGAGKEIIASTIHEWSARRDKPLVTVNCAAIADTLVENELFGHEPGAFTGAGQAKPGLLESAVGGTVFLDEIGECSPQIQAKLLRVLETRRVSRLGAVRERSIDVRWVAATNRDLKSEVEAGRFRSDLLFRLNAASVTVPPLRSRLVEIPLLARLFLEKACIRAGRPVPAFSLVATRRLVEYPWPGNVRELRSLMEYLAATSDAPEIHEHQLPPEILTGRPPSGSTTQTVVPPRSAGAAAPHTGEWIVYPGLYEEVRRLEDCRIREALGTTGGVRVEAARLLDIPLRTFHTKIKEYGIADKSDGS